MRRASSRVTARWHDGKGVLGLSASTTGAPGLRVDQAMEDRDGKGTDETNITDGNTSSLS